VGVSPLIAISGPHFHNVRQLRLGKCRELIIPSIGLASTHFEATLVLIRDGDGSPFRVQRRGDGWVEDMGIFFGIVEL
jgi:hypothetical protein